MNGIDVSEWQGEIDWSRVRTDFAIIRAGYGRVAEQEDSRFRANYEGCRANGIPCGAYWFSYAQSAEEAVEEARACLAVIRGREFEFPVYYDVEDERILSLGTVAVSAIIRAFLDTLEREGWFAGLYMSADNLVFADSDIKRRYALWVADYLQKPEGAGMWQKSSQGEIEGIEGYVDLDESFEDYPTIIRNAGLNNLGKSHTLTVIIDGEEIIRDYRF
ncbi:MAG: glycoside hydrolase [Ruminococcus flavefaciens]|nr:glycoside hydrolase [Ruminococcus flavefaciens]MCM1229230.1 glycoside hydrolase [Ruminococcus flavefaciens]